MFPIAHWALPNTSFVDGQLSSCHTDVVRRACPGWAERTYGVFLPKHRAGNPGDYTPYFEQHADGSYSLIDHNQHK